MLSVLSVFLVCSILADTFVLFLSPVYIYFVIKCLLLYSYNYTNLFVTGINLLVRIYIG